MKRFAMARAMPTRTVRTLATAAALLLSSAALAAEEVIEKVVVKNRLFTLDGKKELGVTVGTSLLPMMTDHNNVNVHAAYNVSEQLAVELRAGYAFSRQTPLATGIAARFVSTSIATATDFSGLWEMKENAVAGLRWAPVYGKISLMSEVPVHFQAFAWLGGGPVHLNRTSVVICTSGTAGACTGFLTEDRLAPVASGAVGARFFIGPATR
jgi:outer membrane beta-barrel protein